MSVKCTAASSKVTSVAAMDRVLKTSLRSFNLSAQCMTSLFEIFMLLARKLARTPDTHASFALKIEVPDPRISGALCAITESMSIVTMNQPNGGPEIGVVFTDSILCKIAFGRLYAAIAELDSEFGKKHKPVGEDWHKSVADELRAAYNELFRPV